MLSFECIKNEKSVYFLLTSAKRGPAPPSPSRGKALQMHTCFNFKSYFFDRQRKPRQRRGFLYYSAILPALQQTDRLGGINQVGHTA